MSNVGSNIIEKWESWRSAFGRGVLDVVARFSIKRRTVYKIKRLDEDYGAYKKRQV